MARALMDFPASATRSLGISRPPLQARDLPKHAIACIQHVPHVVAVSRIAPFAGASTQANTTPPDTHRVAFDFGQRTVYGVYGRLSIRQRPKVRDFGLG